MEAAKHKQGSAYRGGSGMKNKLKSKKGESLIETLAALLIITLTFVFLVNSIARANELKRKSDKMDIPFEYQSEASVQGTIKVTAGDDSQFEEPINVYVCPNDEYPQYSYYYYKP